MKRVDKIMQTKLSVLTMVVLAGSLTACAQQSAAPLDNTTTVNTTPSIPKGGDLIQGNQNRGSSTTNRGQGNRHQHNGRWHSHPSTSAGHTHTTPYKNGAGVNYTQSGQSGRGYQNNNAQGSYRGDSARQNHVGQNQQRSGSATNQGSGYRYYNQTHAGQRGQSAQGGHNTSNSAQNRGRGSANSHGVRQQYTHADLKNPASLLSKRIVYFDYDQAAIKQEYKPLLNAHASYLRANPQVSVRLEGHADDRGSREYNLALSERRARTVRNYLTANGVRSGQMRVVGYGEELPAVTGQGERSWSKNRRVEIRY